ncbi:MAG: helix-turn-helix transcriptional regulator [Clostridia bacterium]|nr:helix-turn-helix transcriptional regulator [Clostridia bacterium]
MMDYEFLGNNLKRLLKEKSWSVKEFSKKSGIGERTIREIIQAKRRKIRMSTLYLLCTTLKTTMKELVGF